MPVSGSGDTIALPSACIIEVDAATGNDGNGGSFDDTAPGGTDYTNGAHQQVVTLDGTTAYFTTSGASATITLHGHAVRTGDAGNTLHVTGGTNAAVGWYVIDSVDATAGTWTLHAACTAGACGDGAGTAGGALATPGQAAMLASITPVAGVYIKAGSTYSIGSTANVSGGRVSTSNGEFWVGYDTTRARNGTDAARPALDAGHFSLTMLDLGASLVANIDFTNNHGRTGCNGLNLGTGGIARGCSTSWLFQGFNFASRCRVEACNADHCEYSFWCNGQANLLEGCVATNSTGNPMFKFTDSGNVVVDCYAIGGYSGDFASYGFTGEGFVAINCASYLSFNSGFDMEQDCHAINCISYGAISGSDGFGFSLNATTGAGVACVINCRGGGNAAGDFDGNWLADQKIGYVHLTADPFQDPATGDYSLNNTAGGGASCRGVSFPEVYPGL